MKFLMRLEGYKLKSYESPKGVWHYGFGHCDKMYNGEPPFKITYQVALKILKEDVEFFLKGCKVLLKVAFNPNQMTALVSFAYNNGLKALETSTLLHRLNNGEDPN